ncbi:MAG: helix-turn-helix domain-containing protein [Actinomycetota bacterium]|nr:helix-turn-helix domain-containing protein [Actinomycetota bacterium]MDQ6945082.1 helix-turn-helix domain-containing protein [Actinomycetota bacterium]
MPETLGQVLAEGRSNKGLSLREVERVTGINNAHLSQIEKGHITQPAANVLWVLAGVYDLEYAKLLRLAGLAGPNANSRLSLANAALHVFGDLTPEEQEQTLEFFDELRKRRATPASEETSGG